MHGPAYAAMARAKRVNVLDRVITHASLRGHTRADFALAPKHIFFATDLDLHNDFFVQRDHICTVSI